jgi:hypothetical protein
MFFDLFHIVVPERDWYRQSSVAAIFCKRSWKLTGLQRICALFPIAGIQTSLIKAGFHVTAGHSLSPIQS